MSSITEPICGNSEQISIWFLPNFANGCCGPKHMQLLPLQLRELLPLA